MGELDVFMKGGEDVPMSDDQASASTETKKCPYCAEPIKMEAIKCRFCGSMLDGSSSPLLATEASVKGRSLLDMSGILLLLTPATVCGFLGMLVLMTPPVRLGGLVQLAIPLISVVLATLVAVDRFRSTRRSPRTSADVGHAGRGAVFWFFITLFLWVVALPAYMYVRQKRRGAGARYRVGFSVATVLLAVGLAEFAHEIPKREAAEVAARAEAVEFRKLLDVARSPLCRLDSRRMCEGTADRELLECAATHFKDVPKPCAAALRDGLLRFFKNDPRFVAFGQTTTAAEYGQEEEDTRTREPAKSEPGGIVYPLDRSFGLTLLNLKRKRSLSTGNTYVTTSQSAGHGWTFVVVNLAISNSLQVAQPFFLSRFGLRDSQGLTYDIDAEAAVTFYSTGLVENVQPNTRSVVTLVFRVPDSITTVGLEDKPSGILATQP